MPEITEQDKMLFEAAARNPMLPRFYANAFGTAVTTTDIAIVLQCNGAPVSMLNLSYSSAKTLIEQLNSALKAAEKAIGYEVKSSKQITEAMNKATKKK